MKNWNKRKTISNDMLSTADVVVDHLPIGVYDLHKGNAYIMKGWIYAANSNKLYIWSRHPEMKKYV